MIKTLIEIKGFKYKEILQLTIGQDLIEKNKIIIVLSIVYFNSKTKIIMNNNEIKPTLIQSMHEVINKVDKWISNGSNWYIDTINNHYSNTAKYKPLNANSYSRKGLINLKIIIMNVLDGVI